MRQLVSSFGKVGELVTHTCVVLQYFMVEKCFTWLKLQLH